MSCQRVLSDGTEFLQKSKKTKKKTHTFHRNNLGCLLLTHALKQSIRTQSDPVKQVTGDCSNHVPQRLVIHPGGGETGWLQVGGATPWAICRLIKTFSNSHSHPRPLQSRQVSISALPWGNLWREPMTREHTTDPPQPASRGWGHSANHCPTVPPCDSELLLLIAVTSAHCRAHAGRWYLRCLLFWLNHCD